MARAKDLMELIEEFEAIRAKELEYETAKRALSRPYPYAQWPVRTMSSIANPRRPRTCSASQRTFLLGVTFQTD